MIRFIAASVLLIASYSQAMAQSVAPIDTLYRAMGLTEIVEIMREEGIAYGEDLRSDLFGGRGGAQWNEIVTDIYDLDQMQATVRNRLDAELAAVDLAPMIDFFSTEGGRKIVTLEVSARRALLEKSVEEASKDMLAVMIANNAPRLDLLTEFAEVGEMVDNNVVGAMNSNYAFYTGLAEGGALPGAMSDEEILADIWSQEEDIRKDTEEWLYSYLTLAYQPLSDDELQAYTAFFRTEAGTALNHAIFAAFDEMFVAISLSLGQGAAVFMAGEEL